MIQSYLKIITGLTDFNQILLLVFAGLFIFRLIFRLLFTGRILIQKDKKGNRIQENSSSVIITVRNEEDNIRENVSKILGIENAKFEVIVVDDFSQDNSYTELGFLKEKFSNLKVSSLHQETRHSTKLAQNIALKAAAFDWVISVSPGTKEFSPDWIKSINEYLRDDKKVVIQYSNVIKAKGFYNKLYRIERFFMQMKSLGYSVNGLPFVYFENNVAFKKEAYFRIGGYGKKIKEPYANLELLINKFISRKSKTINLSKDSIVLESEKINGSDYFELLKKSFRIETHLSFFKRFFLFVDETTRLLFLPLLIFVIVWFFELWPIFVFLCGLRVFTDLLIIKIIQNRLNERKIFIPSLVYDVLIPYFKVLYRWHFRMRSKNQKWRSKN